MFAMYTHVIGTHALISKCYLMFVKSWPKANFRYHDCFFHTTQLTQKC